MSVRVLPQALLVLTLCAFGLSACSGEDDVALSYRQDLSEILTDADGIVRYLVRDDGDTLAITNGALRAPMTADTAYRVRALYVLDDGGAEVYTLTQVFSPNPVQMSEGAMRRDPLQLEALWRGGAYVNFLVTYKSGGVTHAAAFVDRGIAACSDGSRLLRLELYHDSNDDPDYYTQQLYMSCPLYRYAGQLTPGRDSIEVTLTTYDGTAVHRLPY